MITQTVSYTPQPTLQTEVLEFAREQGVEQFLQGLIALSHSTFPATRRFEILLEEDPEIADDRHIVFRLAVPLGVRQSLTADRQWIEGLSRLCPKARMYLFRLSLDLVP